MSFQIFKKQLKLLDIVFIILTSVSIIFLLYTLKFSTLSILGNTLFYSISTILFILLSYIAYKDFKSMEIDNLGSLVLMLSLLTLNLLLYFGEYKESGILINDNFTFIPYENIYLALVLGLTSFLIVLLTKEKAMGSGDIRIGIIIGLLIGRNNGVLWLYITIFSSLIYSLIVGYRKKSLKKLRIPFAPFMILGAILSILIDLFF